MRTPGETGAINRLLGKLGLSTLDDPKGLLNQIAFMVGDEDTFRRMLLKLPPAERHQAYESLKSRLPFTPKPLEEYERCAKEFAERAQLPTIGENGELVPFKVSSVGQKEQVAEGAINDEIGREKLWLVCSKCTREKVFSGLTKVDAMIQARQAGWWYDKVMDREICPRCPAPRPEKAN